MSITAEQYWQGRYRAGRSSGAGSEGAAAAAKAQRINDLIRAEDVESVIDWGVGDGTVLSMVVPWVDYLGVDIAPIVIQRLRKSYENIGHRRFKLLDQVLPTDVAELGMSLDVIFHCVDDEAYVQHLDHLFHYASRLVLIHATDHDGGMTARHVRWRSWTTDVDLWFPDWQLVSRAEDATKPGFYLLRHR